MTQDPRASDGKNPRQSRPLVSHEEIWRRYDAVEAKLTSGVSARMLDIAGLRPGMRVLDIATGRGEPAIPAAHCVGPTGSVVGVERDDRVLEMARSRARAEGLINIELRAGDAETIATLPSAHFHVATARWGLMYMSAPGAALATVRRALRGDGILIAALWAEPERVPYYTLPRSILATRRPVPAIDFESPGAFRFAHLERIERDFGHAGFAVDLVEEMAVPVFESESTADVIEWTRAMGLTRLLNELPASDQLAWEREFSTALERTREGKTIQVGGVTRIVRARVANA